MKERLRREASCQLYGARKPPCLCLAFDAQQPWCGFSSRTSSPSGGPGLTQQAHPVSHARVLPLRVRSNSPPLRLFEPVVTGHQGLTSLTFHWQASDGAGLFCCPRRLLLSRALLRSPPAAGTGDSVESPACWPFVPTGSAAQTWLRSQTPGPTFLAQSAEWGSARLNL